MCPGRCCWGLGSIPLLLLLLLPGQNLEFDIKILQDVVNGTVGQPVLLPVSYRVSSSTRFPLSIRWMFGNSSQTIISCTVLNCSLHAAGAPKNCCAKCLPFATYWDRIELFPRNASLLLRNPRLSDSGVYSVAFKRQNQSRSITLDVHEQYASPEHPGEGNKHQDHTHYYTIGVCSFLGLLLLLLIPCAWQWVRQKKMRTMTQQQASNAEGIRMENTAVRDTATIYARVGESFEQTKPRTSSQAVYTSITSLH